MVGHRPTGQDNATQELAHANTGGMGDSVHQGRDDITLVVAREEYTEHATGPPKNAEDTSSG